MPDRTRGGSSSWTPAPAGATEVLGTYAYSSAFQLNRISYGTTLALVITVLAIPFTVALNRLQRRLSLQGTGA